MFKVGTADRFSFTELDSIAQGDAVLSETLRQTGLVIDGTVGTWVSDITAFAAVLSSWIPPAVSVEVLLTAEGAAARKTLIGNPNYAPMGGACEILEAANKLLATLNVTGQPNLVPAQVIEALAKVVANGRDCVVLTFSLFLLFDKLPRLTTKESREAEVESFLTGLRPENPCPETLQVALRAKAKGTIAR